MKPDLVNIIITKRQVKNLFYYEIIEAGATIDSKTLNWLVQWAVNTNNNILYEVESGANRIGSQDFLKANLYEP